MIANIFVQYEDAYRDVNDCIFCHMMVLSDVCFRDGCSNVIQCGVSIVLVYRCKSFVCVQCLQDCFRFFLINVVLCFDAFIQSV